MKSRYAFICSLMALAVCLAIPAAGQPTSMQRDTLVQLYYQPMFDRPIDPDLYMIRPGDRIHVTFLRTNLAPLDITVSPEGNVIHSSLGLIDARGLTLAQLREKLKTPLAQLYNVKDIAMTVTEPRQVIILVTGAVAKPGRYRVFNSDQVSQVIDMAGGVRPGGSTRFVVLSGGIKAIEADLDRATYLGENSSDPYLYSGTRIDVPAKTNAVVQLIGEVLEPREIELRPGDNLETLVALAGGPTRNADLKKAEILGAKNRDAHQPGEILAGDIIRVPALGEGTPAGVGIFGEVKAPGRYFLQDSLQIGQLLKMAEGPTPLANLGRITIFRLAETDSWERGTGERYPIEASFDAKTGSMMLRPYDSVIVPRQLGWVRVSGLVRAPGMVPFVEGKDALYYITAAGGAVNGASTKEAVVANRISRVAVLVPTTSVVRDGDEVTVPTPEQAP